MQLSYVLALACDLQMNLFVAKHAGLNISWGTELASFSVVLSFLVGQICSMSAASCVGGRLVCVWCAPALKNRSHQKSLLCEAFLDFRLGIF